MQRGWRREEIGGGLKVLQQTVAGAAANPGIAKAFESPEDCGLSFGGTDAYSTGHIDLVRSDGSLACSSLKEPKRGYEGAAWLARAQKEPLLSAPETDPRTGKQVVLAAAPVPKLGVVVAMFNLDGVGQSLGRNYGGPRGLEFVLADGGDHARRARRLAARGCDHGGRNRARLRLAGRRPAPTVARRSPRASASTNAS